MSHFEAICDVRFCICVQQRMHMNQNCICPWTFELSTSYRKCSEFVKYWGDAFSK